MWRIWARCRWSARSARSKRVAGRRCPARQPGFLARVRVCIRRKPPLRPDSKFHVDAVAGEFDRSGFASAPPTASARHGLFTAKNGENVVALYDEIATVE
jgi:hypothetical protein